MTMIWHILETWLGNNMNNVENTKTRRNGGNSDIALVNDVWKQTKSQLPLSKDSSDKWAVEFTKKMRGY